MTQPLQQFTAWSHSRLADHAQCPLRARLKHLDKLPEPAGPALDRGLRIHKEAAAFVAGRDKTAREDLAKVRKRLLELRKRRAAVDEPATRWAFDRDWRPVDWFGAAAWCRMIVDAFWAEDDGVALGIVDFKTGKVRETNEDQVALYAHGAFCRDPAVERVRVSLLYTDGGVELPAAADGGRPGRVYERGQDEAALRARFDAAPRAMLADRAFAPRPGEYCRWCHYRKSNGGPCAY